MMDTNPYAIPLDALPNSLAIFPLTGALLLPYGQLPLNIFEPRYLQMVEDAMSSNRMIGMIQPQYRGDGAPLYEIGCAGKITEFSETTDGRFLIVLNGVYRFRVKTELEVDTLYRQVEADWSEFENDNANKGCLDIDRARLESMLTTYFEQESMSCDFSKFANAPDGQLMTCLSMVCPFEPAEKQALLEKVCCVERAKLFMNLLEHAVHAGAAPDDQKQAQRH